MPDPTPSSEIKARLQSDLGDAMKDREEITVATIRLALAAIKKAEVAGDTQVTLSDDQVVELLRGEGKRRAEAAELYEQGGREELAARERAQAEALQRYLPQEMDDDALAAIVAEEATAVAERGVTGGKAMGEVIKAVRARVGGDASGQRIAATVKTALNA
jgi:uncharacterized protein YqeY